MIDVAIIGGGPAGQAAALELAARGIHAAIFDEQPRPGGQILRQPPVPTGRPPSRDNAPLHALLARFEASAPDWRGNRSVLGIAATAGGFTIDVSGPQGLESIAARRVLVAAGCQDVAVPLPGWTLPGVMAAGGLQAFLKGQRLLAGDNILLCGTHPLMLVIADQIIAAGGRVAGVVFAQTRRQILRQIMAHAGAARRGHRPLGAGLAAFRRLYAAGVTVTFGKALARLEGANRVGTAHFTDGSQIACDTVGLCYGFVPQADLVRAIGVTVTRAGPAGGWRAVADDGMQSSLPGLYVAGETTGVAGAPAAAAGGAVAGIAIAASLGLITPAQAAADVRPFRQALDHYRQFAALLDAVADPTAHWPAAEADTLICRCEDVPLQAILSELDRVATADAVKLASRCGMGVCQGRNCEPSLLRIMAARGIADPGFAARYPARPVIIADLLKNPVHPPQ